MPHRRWRLYHWLAAFPALGLLAGALVANRREPGVLGLPFLLVWVVAWVVLTSVIMSVIYVLDRRADERQP